MSRNSEGSDSNPLCPLHGKSRDGSAAANTPADRIDWAGLPINLDLAFSRNQRDKVLAQHQMLRRGILLRRRSSEAAQVCVCAIADYERSNIGKTVSNL